MYWDETGGEFDCNECFEEHWFYRTKEETTCLKNGKFPFDRLRQSSVLATEKQAGANRSDMISKSLERTIKAAHRRVKEQFDHPSMTKHMTPIPSYIT